jgi:hypothetical protein
MEQKIIYFEKPGPQNTEKTISIAKDRADEIGVKDIVVATNHGKTALEAKKAFKGLDVNIVAVSICEAFEDEGWTMTCEEKMELENEGIKVLTSIHALGDGVGSAFAEKFGGKPIEEIVTNTLYRFCQGMKVCVEIVLMAADAGMIPLDREVMAIAGTDEGADTCIIVKPSYARKFLEFEIREILAKPRNLT